MFLTNVWSERFAPAIIFLTATLVYANTFHAGFTFDDNFAVVNNKDVSESSPLVNLLRHDFWGQDIRSDTSHKSYRPITVFSFRLIRTFWNAVPAELQRAAVGNVDAFPFHAVNVVLHGLVSVLVYWLAYHFLACNEATSAAQSWPKGGELAASKLKQPASLNFMPTVNLLHLLPLHIQRTVQVHALLCGLAFALHPVHTEAVSGIVGHAELLCAAFGILALQEYFRAVDARYLSSTMFRDPSTPPTSQHPGEAAGWGGDQHFATVFKAMCLALVAAFSKEVGITMIGCMMVYDLLELGLPLRHLYISLLYPAGRGAGLAVKVPADLKKHLLVRKLMRLAMCALATVTYVKVRSWVAGDHLVRIYRQVENPIPFCEDFSTRFWSTGWLHTRYFGLLVFPLHLSADWSYRCLPLVESWRDPRNILTVLLYASMASCVLASKFWDPTLLFLGLYPPPTPERVTVPVPTTTRGGRQSSAAAAAGVVMFADQELPGGSTPQSVMHFRWLTGVLVGLIVAPFFPSTNILFYVGTVIGERLLYLPSVGYCLLCTHLIAELTKGHPTGTTAGEADPPQPSQPTSQAVHSIPTDSDATPAESPSSASGKGSSKRHRGRGWVTMFRQMLVYSLLLLMLGWYAQRTVDRNWDWESEEALFLSALKVCPASAKVQLNNGILQRRLLNMTAALEHFNEARRLVPTYCETAYWLGVTLLNSGQMNPALVELQRGLSCKYVAVESVMALNTIFKVLRETNPTDVAPVLAWGQILLHPELERIADACLVLEEAALLLAAEHRNLTGAYSSTQMCTEALKARLGQAEGASPQARLAQAHARAYEKPAAAITPSDADLRQLYDCTKARSIVFGAMAKHGPLSKSVKRHMYRYLNTLGSACRSSPLGPVVHTQLVNRLQSADAYDPWLHSEWAEVLASVHPPRIAEACTHLQAAAALLLSVPLQANNKQGYKPVPGAPAEILALDGEGPISGRAAVEASIRTLQRAVDLGTGHTDICNVLSNLCEARLQLLQMVQSGSTTYNNAQAAARTCMQDLFSNPSCDTQRARFTQQLGKGSLPGS